MIGSNDNETQSAVIPKGEPMTAGTWFLSKTGNPPQPIILASCPNCKAFNEVFGPENNQFILSNGKCKYSCSCGLRAVIQLKDYAGI